MSSQPDIKGALRGLDAAAIRYVLTGSVAASVYGVPVEPRDLDIAPDLEATNLQRLSGLLAAWGAKPVHLPDWPGGLGPEAIERWTPEPATPGNLDHLLDTAVGRFDVVPWRSGWYLDLAPRAAERHLHGVRVLVAHPDDLLATLDLRKEKHRLRAPYLEALRSS